MQEPSRSVPAATMPPGRGEARPWPDEPVSRRARDGLAFQRLRAAPSRVGAILSRHWLFATFVILGVGLRVVVSIAYWEGLELSGDSYDYLHMAHALLPGSWHPSGYALFLALLSVTGHFGVVVVVQHLFGLAMGVLVYSLVLRLGARRWLAALAALPVLLDGYGLSLEQFILAETLTNLLLLGGLAVLFWRNPPGPGRGAVVGLLLAAATLTRTAVVPVVILVGLYLLVRRGHRYALLTYCLVVVAALGAYGGWYAANYGRFGYDDYTGYYLYGRVAPFATCNYALPRQEARLCPAQPVSVRTQNNEFFSDARRSPISGRHLGNHHHRNLLGERFAITVIEHQPLDYLGAVLADTWHYFTPGRWMATDQIDMQRWRFPPPHIHPHQGGYHVFFANWDTTHKFRPSPDPALMGPLRTYQSIFYMPGPAFLACLIGAFAVAVGLFRRRAARVQARWAALVFAASGFLVILSPSMIWGFSYRYAIPLLVLFPPAGAVAADLAIDAVVRRRRGGTSPVGASSTPAPEPVSDRTRALGRA